MKKRKPHLHEIEERERKKKEIIRFRCEHCREIVKITSEPSLPVYCPNCGRLMKRL